MTNQPPLGYTIIPPPGTLKEAYVDYRMVDKGVTIVKSAIQQYIDSFLNPNGVNRKYLTSTVSPVGLQFVTDLTYDDQMKTNPNLRKTYLARFFVENIGRLPSILLIDTGVEIQDPGINDLVGASINVDGSWEGFLLSLMKVSLSITTATLSEEDTSTLSTMLYMMMSPLATIINNYILHESGSPWEVRLPLTGLTLGQATSIQIEGDTKTTVWTRALEMTCEFEAQFGIKQPPDTFKLMNPVVGQNGIPLPIFYNFHPNQQISLGTAYPILVEGMLPNYYLGVSDPNIALVTSEPPYVLQPKAQGKALLLVINRSANIIDTGPIIKQSNSYIMDIPFVISR
jgi:hypothetical protein